MTGFRSLERSDVGRHKANRVGRPITAHRRADAGVRDSSTGLLPRVFDGKAKVGPRMKDSKAWEQGISDRVIRSHVLPTASIQRSPPEVHNVVTKRLERSSLEPRDAQSTRAPTALATYLARVSARAYASEGHS